MNNRLFELNEEWYIAKDEENTGICNSWENEIAPSAEKAYVPSIIQQFFPEYHGLAYYWCKFTPLLETTENNRCFLKFGGVDYKADVWLNGKYLGTHEGGEAPFDFEITDTVMPGQENLLAVRVLNPCDRTIDGMNLLNTPHRNKTVKKSAGSNLNHGGIWYGVSMAVVPCAFVKDVFYIPDMKTGEIKITAEIASSIDISEAHIEVKVRDKSYDSDEVVNDRFTYKLSAGNNMFKETVTVPNHKLWDIDTPNLYIVEISLVSDYGTHSTAKKIGFREFHVEDGYFYLNGKKIYIKSAHTGNAFPIGQMFPVRPDHVRKDLIYAKSCGFNMLRAISGMLRPEQLDTADEIGLLIFEECFASWCLGNSQMCDWNDEKSYAEANVKIPEIPLGDEETMLERWRLTTEQMILRDRNHPSVVIWGFLNETRNNGVFREAVKFLSRARELDPSRFITLNGGRFDYDMSIGSASNPYSNEWEHMWGYDGDTEICPYAVENKINRNFYMGDNHYYPTSPMDDSDINLYRNFGKEKKPVFMSELGIGPLFNVIDEYRHFKQYGERLDLEDCSWVEAQSNLLTRDFNRLGLNKVFPFPELLLRESQRNNAIERRQIFDVIRSNPRISGYSLTGLLDHGMCGEGLWSYWRNWKKDMFDAVSDGWAPLRFCLYVSHNIYSGDPITVEAILANEGILKNGEYTARFAIAGENGTVFSDAVKFELDENEFAVPVLKRTLDIKLPKGKYTFFIEMDDAAPRGSEIDFHIKDRRDNYIGDATVSVVGFRQDAKRYLEDNGVTVNEWSGEDCDILLVGKVDPDTVNKAIDAAEKGASVIFLVRECFSDDVPEATEAARRVVSDFTKKYYHDWLYHKECVLVDRDIFDGFGNGLALLRDFVGVFPGHIFKTEITPDYPICPAFQTGYFAVEGAYMLAYAVFGQNFGKGRVFFSSFEILDNIGHPSADRILSNIVKYLNK